MILLGGFRNAMGNINGQRKLGFGSRYLKIKFSPYCLTIMSSFGSFVLCRELLQEKILM